MPVFSFVFFALLFFSGCALQFRDYCKVSARPLNEKELLIYRDVERCVGVQASPPEIVYALAEQCPLGNSCCIAYYPAVPCQDNQKLRCGVHGLYDERCQRVILPRLCYKRSVLRHEFIHHLLEKHGYKEGSRMHTAPQFEQCEEDKAEESIWKRLFR